MDKVTFGGKIESFRVNKRWWAPYWLYARLICDITELNLNESAPTSESKREKV